MCHGDPSICRCGWCFVARMDPSKFTGNPGILGPGPFKEALIEYEKERYERKDYFKIRVDTFKPSIDLDLMRKIYRKNKDYED